MIQASIFKNEDFLSELVVSLVGDDEIKEEHQNMDEEVELKNKYNKLTDTCQVLLG